MFLYLFSEKKTKKIKHLQRKSNLINGLEHPTSKKQGLYANQNTHTFYSKPTPRF